MTTPNILPNTLALGMVTLRTANLNRSLDFYQKSAVRPLPSGMGI